MADISNVRLPDNQIYNLKDNQARSDVGGILQKMTFESDYFIYNGIRVYFSATEPTGDIPDGSIWIGGAANFVVDATLDTTSTNAIQNQAVANAIGNINAILEGVL